MKNADIDKILMPILNKKAVLNKSLLVSISKRLPDALGS
jgi:hypothetical protein